MHFSVVPSEFIEIAIAKFDGCSRRLSIVKPYHRIMKMLWPREESIELHLLSHLELKIFKSSWALSLLSEI